MKTTIHNCVGALLLTVALITASLALAQTVRETQVVTTTEGTLSAVNDGAIVITSPNQLAPLSYTFNRTTTYVDEHGDPVEFKEVTTGLPVTIYYTKVGDTVIASKVMVRKTAVVTSLPAQVKEAAMSTGVVTEIGPSNIVIKTTTSSLPLIYSFNVATTYVDNTGTAIDGSRVQVGAPVSIYFIQRGTLLLATKIVVQNVVPGTVVEETKTTTTITTNK